MSGDMTGVWMPTAFMRMCERNANTALLLAQIIYWHTPDDNGNYRVKFHFNGRRWLVKQYTDFEAEIEVGISTLKRSMKWLEDKGWIETQVKHSPFHNGETALFITVVQDVFLAAFVKASSKVLVFPVKDQFDTSGNTNLTLPYTETTTESKEVAPKTARYDYLHVGSSFDRSSTPEEERDERGKIGLDKLPPIGREVISLILKYNPKAKKELSDRQVQLLKSPVPTLKGEKPSPHDLAMTYPGLWKQFMEGIETMPAWKKRVIENKERVSAGLVIQLMRGYEWQGGFLCYIDERKPIASATDFYEGT